MSTISLRIPDSLHVRVKELAKQDNISINQFIATALAEKMAALVTEEYLIEKGKLGNKKNFKNALSKIRNVDPEVEDSID